MIRKSLLILALIFVPAWSQAQEPVRFRAIDIVVTTESPLAAWQLEIIPIHGKSEIVGVEGGEPSAYREAPFYDSEALADGHLVIASFSTDNDLPSGTFRVATLMVQESGDSLTEYKINVMAAIDRDATSIKITASTQERE